MRYALRRPSRLLLFLLLATASVSLARSRSFFVPRSITHNNVYELALRNYKTFWNQSDGSYGRAWLSLFATPFYTQSVKEQDLGRFFTPCNQNPFVADAKGGGNVNSIAFSIKNPNWSGDTEAQFRSLVNLRPRRTAYGVHFGLAADTNYFCRDTWFTVDFAAMGVKHQLDICEFNVRNPGNKSGTGDTRSRFRNMKEALHNPDWCYGKFPECGPRRKAGVDDIQLKLGYDWHPCAFDHFSMYLLATIPTGDRQMSEYVFEPVVGTRHGALGMGINAASRFYECGDNSLTAMADIKFRYMFSATQRRSFDLKARGDWSRYLNVSPRGGNTVLFEPGINHFTLNCTVKPRAVLDAWLALHYQWCNNWHIEAGYDFWYRVGEQVKDPCGFDERYGFHRLPSDGSYDWPCLFDADNTISCATINRDCSHEDNGSTCLTSLSGSAASDATLQVLSAEDLDLCYAGHPRAFTHTVYGVVAYDTAICERSVTFGLGGSYEAPQDKKYALEQWAVWGTVTVAL